MLRLEDLQNYLKDKAIAIIGNAESVLEKERLAMGAHDIIVRMNKGFPQGKEKYLGSRTDVLALAIPLDAVTIKEKFNPKHIIWINVNNTNPSPAEGDNLFIYPQKFWDDLCQVLGHYPSTGCMVTDLILNRCNCKAKNVFLYGFDFWKTGTWYHREQNYYPSHPHNPKKEEVYITGLLNKGN